MGLVYFGIGPSSKVSTTSSVRGTRLLLVFGEFAVQRAGFGVDFDDARHAERAFGIGAGIRRVSGGETSAEQQDGERQGGSTRRRTGHWITSVV
jgi:hypothetical protein